MRRLSTLVASALVLGSVAGHAQDNPLRPLRPVAPPPVVAEPAAGEPPVAEPAAGEPPVAEPAAGEPPVADPAVVAEPPAAAALSPGTGTRFVHAPERYMLANGLSVALDPMPGTGSVAIVVAYHVGARDQAAGYTGLAHLCEHMMFEGSEHAPGHFLDALDAMGATERNGTTSRDETTYYELVPAEQLDRALFLEADRMAFLLPAMREARVANQRAVVLRERTERVDLGGLGLLPGLMAGVLYPAPHPYAELFEHREDVESLGYAQVAWFVQTWYAPDNATIAIAGDIDPAHARATIERLFGPILRTGEPRDTPPVPTVTQLLAERRLVVEAPVRRDQLLVIWPTPAWGAPGDAELDLIARELDTRLNALLVDGGRATSVSVAQRSSDLASELQVTIETGRGHGTLDVLMALDAEIQQMRFTPLSRGRVAALHRIETALTIERLESPVARAQLLASRVRSSPDGRWSFAWELARHLAPDGPALMRTVQRWLPVDRRLVLSLAANRDAPFEGRVAVDLTIPPGGAPGAAPGAPANGAPP